MKLFGTDGIRGDASTFPFDGKTLFIIGKALAEVLGGKKPVLMIRDTRESGKRIQKSLAEGILSAGVKTVFGGVMATPAASFLMSTGKYSAAVVISASHNPYADNGIKIFGANGLKLSDFAEEKIEKRINKFFQDGNEIKKKKIAVKENAGLLKRYEAFIVKSFGKGSLKGKTVIVDCANGASYKSAPDVLRKLGAKVIAFNIKPDGKNINLNCGALHPEFAAKKVKEHKAFCGFAFDGDADRLICIDEKGFICDGDYFLASMARYLKKEKKLKNDTLVTTVMANIGLLKAMKDEKIKTVKSKVGDRYVLEDMKKHNAVFGGEQSGHFIFSDILGTGDGLLSAVQLLSALENTGKALSEFVSGIEKFPQILINRKVAEKIPFEKLPVTSKLIKKYEKELDAEGRVLVRYSGTENLLRVMAEGKDRKEIKKIAEEIINCADKEINGKIK